MAGLQYKQLIKETARRLHLPDETVTVVLETVLQIVKEAVCHEQKVVFRNFGSFRPSRAGLAATVRFRPAKVLKATIQEAIKPMEKYNVEINNEAALLAKVTGKCPQCLAELDQKDPPHCPVCGTAPFETKRKAATERQTGMVEGFNTLYGTKNNEEK